MLSFAFSFEAEAAAAAAATDGHVDCDADDHVVRLTSWVVGCDSLYCRSI